MDELVLCLRIVDFVICTLDQLCLKAMGWSEQCLPSLDESPTDLRQNIFATDTKLTRISSQ